MSIKNVKYPIPKVVRILCYSFLLMAGIHLPLLSNSIEGGGQQEEVAEAMRQFKAIIAFNEKCEKEGHQEKSIFFVTYRPGQTLNLEEYYDCGGSWFKYERIDATTDIEMFSDDLCTYLNNELQAFNSPPEERSTWSNPDRIHIYSFYANFMKLAVKADVDALVGANDVLEYLGASSQIQDSLLMYSFFSELKNRKATTFDFGSNVSNVLIYGLSFKSKYWKDKKRSAGKSGLLSTGDAKASSAARTLYIKEKFKTRTYANDLNLIYKTQKKYVNSVLSNIEYFKSSAIQALYSCLSGPSVSPEASFTGEESCAELQGFFCNPVAIEFLQSRCSLIDNPNYLGIKEYAFKIALHIQNSGIWFENYVNTEGNSYDGAYYGPYLNDYIAYYTAIQQSGSDVTALYDDIDTAIEANDWNKIFFLLKSRFTASIYYKQLSIDQRVGILRVLVQGPLLGEFFNFFDGSQEGEILKILQFFPTSATPAEVQFFLDKIEQTPNLLERLFAKMHDEFGDDNYSKFVLELTRMSLKRHNITSMFDTTRYANLVEASFFWRLKNRPKEISPIYTWEWLSNSNSNKIVFGQKICESILVQPGYNLVLYSCPEHQWSDVQLDTISPFDMVSIAVVDKLTFLKNCQSGQCKGTTIIVPALTFAFMLNKRRTQQNFDNLEIAVNTVGLLIGTGELMIAIKTANRLKYLLAGWELGADLANLVVSSEGFNSWCQESGNANLCSWVQIISTVNLTVASLTNLYDFKDAAKAVAAVEKLKHINQTGDIDNLIDITEAGKRADNFEKELMKTPEGRSELALARTQLGLFSQDLISKMDNILPTANFPTLRLALETKLNTSPDLLALFNAQPDLVRAWKSIAEHPQMGDLINSWDVAKYNKLFEDLKDNTHLITEFAQHPEWTKPWDFFKSAQDESLTAFATNKDILKRLSNDLSNTTDFPNLEIFLKTGDPDSALHTWKFSTETVPPIPFCN